MDIASTMSEPAAATDPLRHLRRQASGLVAAGAALLLVAGVMGVVIDDRSDEWRRDADRVTGTIVGVRDPVRGDTEVDVEFAYRGAARAATVAVKADPRPRQDVGDEILVFVDPDDPDRVSVPGGSPLGRSTELLFVGVPAIVGFIALVLAATLGFRARELRRQAARLAALPRGPNRWC